MDVLIKKRILEDFQKKIGELSIAPFKFEDGLWSEEILIDEQKLDGDFFEIIEKVASKRGNDPVILLSTANEYFSFCEKWELQPLDLNFYLSREGNSVKFHSPLLVSYLKKAVRDSIKDGSTDSVLEKIKGDLSKKEYRAFEFEVAFAPNSEKLILEKFRKIHVRKKGEFAKIVMMVSEEITFLIREYRQNIFKMVSSSSVEGRS